VKHYTAVGDAALQRAINRFARACEDKAFQGTIPVGESEEAAEAYDAVDRELNKARACLERLVERRVER